MILDVDTSSAVPPYDQIRAQLTSLITGGALAPGTRLPAIRQLAGDLGIAPGTVARAYRELEHAGLVATRGRHGTRVTAPSDRAPATPAHGAHLDEAAAAFAAAAARAGANLDQAVGALRRAFAHMTVTPLADTPADGAPPSEPRTEAGALAPACEPHSTTPTLGGN